MRLRDFIRLGLLAVGTFAVATLGAVLGGSIAAALGVGDLAPVFGAFGGLIAIVAALLLLEVVHRVFLGRTRRAPHASLLSRQTARRSARASG
jgi:hypothetical protein